MEIVNLDSSLPVSRLLQEEDFDAFRVGERPTRLLLRYPFAHLKAIKKGEDQRGIAEGLLARCHLLSLEHFFLSLSLVKMTQSFSADQALRGKTE